MPPTCSEESRIGEKPTTSRGTWIASVLAKYLPSMPRYFNTRTSPARPQRPQARLSQADGENYEAYESIRVTEPPTEEGTSFVGSMSARGATSPARVTTVCALLPTEEEQGALRTSLVAAAAPAGAMMLGLAYHVDERPLHLSEAFNRERRLLFFQECCLTACMLCMATEAYVYTKAS